MANIVIESNNGCVKIDLGNYKNAPYNLKSPYYVMKSNIEEFFIENDAITVITKGRNNHSLYLSTSQKAPLNDKVVFMIVDSVNGSTPSSTDNLAELIYNCFN